MIEKWKPWRVGNYEVSSHGRVRRAKPGRRTWVGRQMKLVTMKIGYYCVGPTVDGRNVTTLVHEMVAECFIGKRPAGFDINHKDGNKKNNMVCNLEYVTHDRNMKHASETGLLRKGEEHVKSKLTTASVVKIRELASKGARTKDLSESFGVSPSTISGIKHNHNWTHV